MILKNHKIAKNPQNGTQAKILERNSTILTLPQNMAVPAVHGDRLDPEWDFTLGWEEDKAILCKVDGWPTDQDPPIFQENPERKIITPQRHRPHLIQVKMLQ